MRVRRTITTMELFVQQNTLIEYGDVYEDFTKHGDELLSNEKQN